MAEQSGSGGGRKWLIRGGVAAAGLVVLLVLLVLLAPTLLSTGMGTRFVLGFVNDRIAGRVTIADLRLAWFGGQSVDGIEVADPSGQPVVSVGSVELADASLWSLIRGSRDLGAIKVDRVRADVVREEGGALNLQAAFAPPAAAAGSGSSGSSSSPPASKPASSGGLLPPGLSLELTLTDVQASFTAPDMAKLELSMPTGQVNIPSPADITVDLSAAISQGGSSGGLTAKGKIKDLFDAAGALALASADLDVTLQAADFPLDAADRIAGLGGKLTALLGTTLNASVVGSGGVDALDLAVKTRSAHLNADLKLMMTDQGLANDGAGRVLLTVTPEAWAALTRGGGGSTLSQPMQIVVDLDRLTAPKRGDELAIGEAAAEMSVTMSDSRITLPQLGEVDLSNTSVKVSTAKLSEQVRADIISTAALGGKSGTVKINGSADGLVTPDGAFNTAGEGMVVRLTGAVADFPAIALADELLQQGGLLVDALGPMVNANLQADWTAQTGDGRFVLKASTASSKIDLAASMNQDAFTAVPGSSIDYVLSPAVVSRLTGEGGVTLAKPAPIKITINQLAAPIEKFDLGAVAVGATITVGRINPVGVDPLDGVTIEPATVQLASTTLNQPLSVTAATKLVRSGMTAEVNATAKLGPATAEGGPALESANIDVTSLPVTILDPGLVALLGDTLDRIELTVNGDPRHGPTKAGASVQSSLLTAELNGEYRPAAEGAAVSLASGSHVSLTLEPQRFDRFIVQNNPGAPAAIRLAAPATVKADINTARVELPFNPAATEINAQLTSTTLQLIPSANTKVNLSDLKAALRSESLADAVTLEARGNVTGADDKEAGRLDSTTTLNRLFNDAGGLDLENLTLKTETDIANFPIALADELSGAELRLLPILGPMASIKLNGNLPGDLTLSAQSPTSSIAAAINVNDQRQLTLREDIVATLYVTPQMAREFLGNMHPMFQDAVESEKPVRLVVNKSASPIPLTGLQIEQLKLSGTLDGGVVKMRRGGWLDEGVNSLVSSLLKALGSNQGLRRPEDIDTYPATFTLMTWTLDNGVLDASQTWVTSPDLAVGFIGSINLQDPANATIRKMVMGVLEASLIIESPILKNFIQPDQIAELPLSGRLADPTIDYGIFIQDIVGSVAVQTTRQLVPGGWGGLVGGVIEGVGQGIKEDRQRKLGVSWDIPPAGQELIRRAQQMEAPPDDTRQQQQQQQQQDQQQRGNPLEDTLRNLFGG